MLAALGDGATVTEALAAAGVPPAVANFVRTTFAIIDSDSTPAIAAAFTYGREDVIPDMFRHLVTALAEQDPAAWGRFRFYLERHIAHDDAKHAPICRRIVAGLCGDDEAKWAAASRTARQCLEARIALWDAIADSL
jgi:pyrroloquinoline quinone (PQQ) biosynthesis protein C